MRSLAGRLAALVVVVVYVPVLSAAPVPPTKTPTESPVQKLKKELDIAITVEIEQPLTGAVAELREQTKINLVLDRFSLQMMGMDPDGQNVTLKGKNLKLRTGLKTMLQQCNLTYVVIGESVLITTEEMAVYRQLKQRVNVEADKVELKAALKKLSTDTGVNIILDPKLAKEGQTPVTLEVDDVPLESAVRLLAELAGLKTARVGNVLMVTTKESAKSLQSDPELAPRPLLPGEGGLLPGGMDGAIAPPAVPFEKPLAR